MVGERSRGICKTCFGNVIHYSKTPRNVPPFNEEKNVRIGILDKHTQIIYRYTTRKKKIEVLLFWGMKQNPSKLKY